MLLVVVTLEGAVRGNSTGALCMSDRLGTYMSDGYEKPSSGAWDGIAALGTKLFAAPSTAPALLLVGTFNIVVGTLYSIMNIFCHCRES